MNDVTVILKAIDQGSAGTDELLALDQAQVEFTETEPRKAELVRLRYFAGLTEQEAAKTLDISRATASRWWTYARTWLYDRLSFEASS
ncbi:MAG: ECF-type sigma factor [Fuerstiella sp.]